MRLDEEIAKYYYTAAQARKVLGLDEQAFQYRIRQGHIKKTILPGKRQGLYSKREIHAIVNQIEATLITEKIGGYEYKKASPNELEEGYELAYLIFGRGAYPLDVRQRFMEINPDIFYHLYDNDELVGLLNIIPFKPEVVSRFMQGEIRIKNIDPNDVETFTPGKQLECIFVEVITTPTVPPSQRSHYGAHLISKFATETAHEWASRGVEIAKLYGTSSTQTGLRILKSAGFEQLDILAHGRYAYELDVEKSEAPFLRDYRETLEQWKKQQIDMPSSKVPKTRKSKNTSK